MALPPVYRIVPPIGIARVGDAPADVFFIGPEAAGRPPEGDPPTGTAVPPFKDGGKIKRQAARFRIWEYKDNGAGKYAPSAELTLDSSGVANIEWTVQLANKKAAFFKFDGLLGDPEFGPSGIAPVRRNGAAGNDKKLWLDPGPRKISGRSKKGVEFRKGTAPAGVKEYWPSPAPAPTIDCLGELRTDPLGRLVVIGGQGLSSRRPGAPGITTYANNDGWFDDVSDGPVTAKIKFSGGKPPVDAAGAWVLVGPPDFAPYASNTVTLYDTLFDLAARRMALPADDVEYTSSGAWANLVAINAELKVAGRTSLSTYKPDFDSEIWPILRAGLQSSSLFKPAQFMHSTLGSGGNLATMWPALSDPSGAPAARQAVFTRLRAPADSGDGVSSRRDMPRLLGDDPYLKWSVAKRKRLSVSPTQYALLEQWVKGNFVKGSAGPPGPPANVISPTGLTRAALQAAVGGAFFPGIEVGWQIRHQALYQSPFRIKHGAGSTYISDVGGVVGPGHFSRQMALPWQADFLQCKNETAGVMWGWWPAQRPDHVYRSLADASAQNPMVDWHRSTAAGVVRPWAVGFGTPPNTSMPSYDEMLANWAHFGIERESGTAEYEDERPANVP
jgi:hypothetical protein